MGNNGNRLWPDFVSNPHSKWISRLVATLTLASVGHFDTFDGVGGGVGGGWGCGGGGGAGGVGVVSWVTAGIAAGRGSFRIRTPMGVVSWSPPFSHRGPEQRFAARF